MNPNSDIVQLMIAEVEQHIETLRKHLLEHGIISRKDTIEKLVNLVISLKTRKTDREYLGVIKDGNGYVVNLYRMDDFIENKNIPVDATDGYYLLIDDKFILDEERQRQIEEV